MIKDYLNDKGEVVLPKPKYQVNQNVLVIHDGMIEIRQIQEVIYRPTYNKCPVFYKVNCMEGYVAESEIFGTPQEFSEAILSTFGIDKFGRLRGDWSRRHWGN